jgi:hypothetical protein
MDLPPLADLPRQLLQGLPSDPSRMGIRHVELPPVNALEPSGTWPFPIRLSAWMMPILTLCLSFPAPTRTLAGNPASMIERSSLEFSSSVHPYGPNSHSYASFPTSFRFFPVGLRQVRSVGAACRDNQHDELSASSQKMALSLLLRTLLPDHSPQPVIL